MRGRFRELLSEAESGGRAVAAFTVYGIDGALGAIAAAERQRTGVVLLISQQTFVSDVGLPLVAALKDVAARAAVPVCLQLDHVSDLDLIAAALASGIDVIMADGSKLPDDENVAFVRAAAALAAKHGASLEAELGRIEGDEEIARGVRPAGFTDPGAAASFVAATGVACLAVSIGNVHGRYASPPRLDFELLAEIDAAVPCALSLHGASGIPDADVRRAIGLGVRKVNVNTELRERYFQTIADEAPRLREGSRVLALSEAISEAVADAAAAKIEAMAAAPV
ncbi:MAG: class II fructose-bisphosphate aldolase [Solirubrobacterales bacterium]